MAENFRLYCLDNSGHIGLADWIKAETFDEAIEKARKLHQSELWLGKALVAEVSVAGELVSIAKLGHRSLQLVRSGSEKLNLPDVQAILAGRSRARFP